MFTEKDLAIFQRIADLRASEKLGNEQIKERLRTDGIDTLTPYIDLATAQPLAPATAPQTTTSPQESPQQPQGMIELYQGIIGHTTAIQAHIDSLQARVDAQDRDRTGRVTLLALGFVAGLLVAAILIGAAWLMK